MGEAKHAMATWFNFLTESGLFKQPADEYAAAGRSVATYVLGAERMAELRNWLVTQTASSLEREVEAVLEACIHVAHADRHLHEYEASLLKQMIEHAQLPDGTKERLLRHLQRPIPLGHVEWRVKNPILREMLLCLAWELALADGKLAKEEMDFIETLVEALEIDEERSIELRAALSQKIG